MLLALPLVACQAGPADEADAPTSATGTDQADTGGLSGFVGTWTIHDDSDDSGTDWSLHPHDPPPTFRWSSLIIKNNKTFFARAAKSVWDQGTVAVTANGLTLTTSSRPTLTVTRTNDAGLAVCEPGGVNCQQLDENTVHFCAQNSDCKQQCVAGDNRYVAHECATCDVNASTCMLGSDDGTQATAAEKEQPLGPGTYDSGIAMDGFPVFALKSDGYFFAKDHNETTWHNGTYRFSDDGDVLTLTSPDKTWALTRTHSSLNAYSSVMEFTDANWNTNTYGAADHAQCWDKEDCDKQRGGTCIMNNCQ
jgi:hypothetical protein